MNKFLPRVIFFLIACFVLSIPVSAQTPILYGMTWLGGTNDTSSGNDGAGTIFNFNPANDSEAIVWNFGRALDAAQPQYGRLVYDTSSGLFYGTTMYGGSYDEGAIFTFNPVTGNENVVWSFANNNAGRIPLRSVVRDANNGLFYGTTLGGGDNNTGGGGDGTIFSFNPVADTAILLWSFGNTGDGIWPYSDLISDPGNGLYYGTTTGGGNTNCPGGCGIIFSFNPDSNTEHVVWRFGSAIDGANPYGNLVYYPGNKQFYGMTSNVGSNPSCYNNCGTIFTFDPATNTERVVWNLGSGKDGVAPFGTLVYDANNGLFYGMTSEGGSNPGADEYGDGTIISFNPANDSEKVVWNFGGTGDGTNPRGDLIYDAVNNLFYGLTTNGGTKSGGVLFSFNPANNKETVLWNFGASADGVYPPGTLTLFGSLAVTAVSISASSVSICPGTPVTFTATVANGGTQPVYEWEVNGNAAGGDSCIFITSALNNNDTLICILTSNASAVSGSPATSNAIIINVSPGNFLAGTISASQNPVCAGTGILLTDSGSAGALQWQSSTGSNSFSNIPGATDSVYNWTATQTTSFRVIAGTGNCADTSLPYPVIVNPLPAPVIPVANDTIICPSDSAMLQEPGDFASYSWNDDDTGSYTYVKSAGGYWVTVTDTNGCSAVSGHRNVSVYPVSSISLIEQGDTLSSYGAVSYQWLLNGQPIAGATSATYIATQTGNYTLQETDTNNCIAVSNPNYVDITGISNMLMGTGIKVYPNPFSNSIFIDAQDAGIHINRVGIYDMLGRTIFDEEMSIPALPVRIDLPDLPKGVYYLKITAGEAKYVAVVRQ